MVRPGSYFRHVLSRACAVLLVFRNQTLITSVIGLIIVYSAHQVCYHSATQSSPFDVSFPKKLLKFVATRGKIFSLKFTKYCLAAGLRPDPLEG